MPGWRDAWWWIPLSLLRQQVLSHGSGASLSKKCLEEISNCESGLFPTAKQNTIGGVGRQIFLHSLVTINRRQEQNKFSQAGKLPVAVGVEGAAHAGWWCCTSRFEEGWRSRQQVSFYMLYCDLCSCGRCANVHAFWKVETLSLAPC